VHPCGHRWRRLRGRSVGIDNEQVALVVLGYPQLGPGDLECIEGFRNEHDMLYRGVVNAHFTLVFPTEALSADALVAHVRKCALDARPIDFVLRSALVVADDFADAWHVFLVPDEGNSRFIKLHDRLYQGPIAHELRLDISYIPHLGIASNADSAICKALADDLNGMNLAIQGQISELTISDYDGTSVHDLARAILGE
jgi:2'-5' RNA ligase